MLLVSSLFISIYLIPVTSNGYIGVSSTKNFSDAEVYCQSIYDTSLATITSFAENNAVRDAAVAAGFSNSQSWIGGSSSANSSFVQFWEWNDGTPFTYSNWNAGEPNNYDEKCIESKADGTWNDWFCSGELPFVCNYPQYTAVSLLKTWNDAELYCNNQGYSLATITNKDSNIAAYNASHDENITGSYVWIGLYSSTSNPYYHGY